MKLKIGLSVCQSLLFGFVGLQMICGGESEDARRSTANPAGVVKHVTRTDTELPISEESSSYALRSMTASEAVTLLTPTRASFIATWKSIPGASNYRLDVSTDPLFRTYLKGYENSDAGSAMALAVTGLRPGTTYYYRVAFDANGGRSYSSTTTVTTKAGAGLIINPTFDSSITSNVNATTIEAAINQAISIYESLFSDSVAVNILFRYANTEPDGTTPLGGGTLAESESVIYQISWNEFIAVLQADATTSNDITANSSLPGTQLSTNILPSSANGRAVGLVTPGVLCEDGTFNCFIGTLDGIVTLNSNAPFQFARPPTTGNYDGVSATEHEIDEVLGLGSYLNFGSTDLRPQDLFSWSSLGVRNLTSSGSRFFSIDGGGTDIVDFNQNPNGDFGDWLSSPCPQINPFVQNAFGCSGQADDVTATSPEGINLDVIGYNLVAGPTPTPSPTPSAPYGIVYSPSPGSTLASSKTTFSWSIGTSSSAYWLLIGDGRVTEPGGHNIYSSSQTGARSITVSNLPTDGRTLYVRLWSNIGGSWYTPPQDYTYVAYPGITLTPVISPKSGSYKKSVMVSILDGTPGATISYSTNGGAPTTPYAGPFPVTGKGTHTVRAIATSSNAPNSGLASATYTIK